MEEINKSVLDGSNEEASKRLDEIIKELEKQRNKNYPLRKKGGFVV
nr:MAG TPA: hypothetical protein [Caudoviricetes sp.]